MAARSPVRNPLPGAPAVSVGMPAYNSAAWIEAAVGSILGQSHRDLELIISDNASTDNTFEICERLARADSRIRLLRNARNIGANRNYLAVLQAARGTYFKWASSNDICAPTFIERCVAALASEPDAVVACPRTWLFEDSIETARPYDRDFEIAAPEPAVRFVALLNALALNNVFNGLMRRSALIEVATMGSHMAADVALMAELALKGKFVLVDERLFYRRMSAETATKLKSAREVDQHLVPHARKPLRWQYWRFHLALLRAAVRSAPAGRNWFEATSYALRAMLWSRRELARDIRSAMQRTAW
jgi:glycosyltransferase involved in cell wall biosynthesis